MNCNKWKYWGAGIMLGLCLTGCGDSMETVEQEALQALPITQSESLLSEEAFREETSKISNEISKEGILEKEALSDEISGGIKDKTDGETNAETVPESSEEAVPETIKVKISFAGDFSLGNHHKQDYAYSFNQEYEKQTPDYFLENVKEVFAEDDMTLVNFEGVLTGSNNCVASKEYNIKGDPEYVNILLRGNVECVGLANNHALDYGVEGRADTIKALKDAGITYAYEDQIGLYEANGINVGYVAYTATGNVIPKGLKEQVQKGLQALEEAGADLKIVCFHWGVETKHYPEDVQTTFAHEVIDMGADLIIGHHPHVLQGMEEYHGKMIVYSLGNFCFGANRNPKDKDTVIYQQTFSFTDGVLDSGIDSAIIPCSISSSTERNNYQPTVQEGKEAVRILDKVNEYSKNFGIWFDEDGCYRSGLRTEVTETNQQ